MDKDIIQEVNHTIDQLAWLQGDEQIPWLTDADIVVEENPVHILHIEDSPWDAQLFQSMLKREFPQNQVTVTHVKKLSKGIKALTRQHYDLVITDLSLPDSSEKTTVKAIKRYFPLVPTIVFTGSDEPSIAAETFRQGAKDYFVKGRTKLEAMGRSIRTFSQPPILLGNYLR